MYSRPDASGSTAQELGDDAAELAALAADLRTALAWHARAGAWAAPGGASPVVDWAPAAEATPAEVAPMPEPVAAAVAAGRVARPSRLTLPLIREDLGDCTRCKLHGTRTNIVFGVGAGDAPLMFVGEAPGADEDRRGEPFVGRAGEL